MAELRTLPDEELVRRAEGLGRRLLASLADAREQELTTLLDERAPLFEEIGRRRAAGGSAPAGLDGLLELERQLHAAARDTLGSLRGAMNALAATGQADAPPFVERVEGAQLLDRHA